MTLRHAPLLTASFLLVSLAAPLLAQKATAAPQLPEREVCRNTLMKPAVLKDPTTTWDTDSSFVPGIKEDPAPDPAHPGTVEGYIVGDKLDLRKEIVPSLYRPRSIPNTKVRKVTFDGREINVDMPLVFESTNVSFYAQTLRIGPRGSIVFTTPPTAVDSLVFVVNTLDLSNAPLHPFVFITGDTRWPGASKRLVTVIAQKVIYKAQPADERAFFASLTLDENYASFADQVDKLKAYSVDINNEKANQQLTSYMTDTMLWPLETAQKISRQFASAPFDPHNQEFLKTKIQLLYATLPPNSHPLARNIAAQTLQSMNLGVDSLGFYPNYVPRLLYPKLVEDVRRQQAEDLKNMQSWDDELIAAQKGVPLTATVGSIAAEVRTVDADLDSNQEKINDDITALGRYEGDIVALTGKVEQYRRDDRQKMSEDEKHQRDAAGVLIGAKVVMVAASLCPISAPVAIAIGTGAALAGKQIAGFQEGEVPNLGNAVRDIPEVLQEAKDFNALASNLKGRWEDVSAKYDAYHKQQVGTPAAPPTAAKPGDKPPDPKQALTDSVGSFVTSLTDLVSHLNNPQPTQLREDKYDEANKDLQLALQHIGDIRQQEASTTADLAALQQKLRDGESRIGKLGTMRADLSRLDVEDDLSRAQRESLAWGVRQQELRSSISQAVLLLRSYKYHTLQDPPTHITEAYLAAQYDPTDPLEHASDDKGNDFFRTPGRTNLKTTLDTERQHLQTDLDTLVTNLDSGYVTFQNGFIRRGTGDPEYQSTCEPMQMPRLGQPRDPNCEFILALNAEIARQWKYVGSPHPAAIPIPLKIKRTYRDTPRRLWDVSVRVEYKDVALAKYGTIEFDVEHPMFGELWGAKDDDCTLVDMRKLGDTATIQPYLSICNGDTPCEHNKLELPTMLREENDSHAPLPLDTIYFLKPIVSAEKLREPPQVKTIYIKVWFVE
jgi:hypothetical protein